MPATDVDFEREFEELVRDLRALPTAAPEQLREHVRLLGEPARARTLRDVLPALSLRRSLLVLAPVCVLGLVSAALIHGLVNSGGSQNQALVQRTSGSGGAPIPRARSWSWVRQGPRTPARWRPRHRAASRTTRPS